MEVALLDDIMFHYRHPAHRGQLTGKPVTDSNPSCGDSIELYLVVEQGVIQQASFTGNVCAIANYGAELLCDRIVGQTVDQAKVITSQQLLPADSSLLTNPIRLQCFEAAQRALHQA